MLVASHMSDDSPPGTGGRLVARLVASDVERATYALELRAGGEMWEGRAVVTAADGRLEMDRAPSSMPAPVWLEKLVTTTLRGAWQRHRTGSDWPRRLARWRPGSDGDGETREP